MPLILVTLIALLFSATGMYAYAQVQIDEHTFTQSPDSAPLTISNPAPAAGDVSLNVTLPLNRLIEAMDRQVPQVFYEASENQSLTPYWTIDEIDMRINFRAERLGPAQLNMFGDYVEIMQPARLFITGEAPDVSETESRDFILTARYALTLDRDWAITLEEVEAPRILGLNAPRLFASVTPDMSALTLWLNQDLATNLTRNLNTELNGQGGLRALVQDLADDLGTPTPMKDGQVWPAMGLVSADLVNQSIDGKTARFDLVLSFSQTDQTVAVPALGQSDRQASPLEIPFTFSASIAELSGLLKANERQLEVAGGSLLVNKIKVLRPHGEALLVKVDGEEINPGGHQFKKRGTFHILAKVRFNPETQTIRFSDAVMPETAQQLSFALQGRDWLQSDALASGLVSGLDGIPRHEMAKLLIDQIEMRMSTAKTLPSGTMTWGLDGFTFKNVPTTYEDNSVATNFRARLNALVNIEL